MAHVLPSTSAAPPSASIAADSALSRLPQAGDADAPAFPIELLTPTHYARLGVAETAGLAEIAAAWARLRPPPGRVAVDDERGLQSVAWPQPGVLETAALRTRQREIAHAVLIDPRRRAIYDRWLAEHRDEIVNHPSSAGWEVWLHSRHGHWQIALAITVVATGVLAWLASRG
jgi:hypothetical protein